MGLGVALDDSPLLPSAPVVGTLWQQIESASARQTRLASLGSPTMRGRRDLAQHFAVSAALTILIGPQDTEAIGIIKEMTDSRSGSGFSFVDLSADVAGIQFAIAVADGRVSLARLENRFAVHDFLPEATGFREHIMWKDFVKQYGFPTDERLTRERAVGPRENPRHACLQGHSRPAGGREMSVRFPPSSLLAMGGLTPIRICVYWYTLLPVGYTGEVIPCRSTKTVAKNRDGTNCGSC